ncbi:uncharacterized protein PHACADRAFT_190820 [Phanerochaete carnosa HHB-10118-sp]|uniref:BTB domain-containing protein n=1 Tax=Phanerochaete carnosa (strain HHB-10118-sp) TaxID=650164 RepID=K5VF46_PHACS|nr:uncharacterized protein PHACADRAFT_190820 [Phanerochaete carnosa HHB-10118-sp]EKM61646.1 hypothetical protein PHACADRAFT_190820 [Phanerochaete carnosa HHB-10118-sp]
MNVPPPASRKRPRPASFEGTGSRTSQTLPSNTPPGDFSMIPHTMVLPTYRNAVNYSRSKHVWYSDGNALIRCTSPAGVTVFRVHLTLLSRYAGAFSGDLVSNPLFDNVELSPSYVGTGPAYVLDVTVRRICEFEHFLRAIYEHQ